MKITEILFIQTAFFFSKAANSTVKDRLNVRLAPSLSETWGQETSNLQGQTLAPALCLSIYEMSNKLDLVKFEQEEQESYAVTVIFPQTI